MRFQLLAGLWVALVLALVQVPVTRADPSLNAWNELLMDQLKLRFSAFVSRTALVPWVCVGVWDVSSLGRAAVGLGGGSGNSVKWLLTDI